MIFAISAASLVVAVDTGKAEVSSQTIQVSGNWEVSLGQKLATQAYGRGGGQASLDRSTAGLVFRVFADVARVAGAQKSLPYRLEVLSSSQVDGWSYPGGPVYITMGLLRGIDTADELAGIFGHLLAHQVLGHHLALLADEGLEVAKKVAAGQIPPTKEGIGKPSVALLAFGFPLSMEKQADQLGASLAARAGYSAGGLDMAHAKLAAVSRSNPYFRAHPHPDVRPYSTPPSGIRIVPTPPSPPTPSPVPSEAGQRLQGLKLPAEAGLFGGSFPFRVETGSAQLSYRDDWGDLYTVPVFQQAKGAAAILGTQVTLFPVDWLGFDLSAGAILDSSVLGDGVRLYEPSDAGYLGLGMATRVLGRSGGLELWLSGQGIVAWFSGRAGGAPSGGTTNYIVVDSHQIESGETITASALNLGAGAGLRLEGPVFGIRPFRWFVGGRYQATIGGKYSYTVKDFAGETVTIPFQNDTLEPFRATGVALEAGLALRW